MRWSKCWDQRSNAQSFDDPTTWAWTENQAVCALDAETQNPKQPMPLDQIDLPSFRVQSDIADEDVTLGAGGTEKRYTASGIIAFAQREFHVSVEPLYVAGASFRIRNGGKRAIAPGRFEVPEVTLTDYITGQDLSIETLRRSRTVATTIRASFVNKNVGYEDAELEEYTVPGAATQDGGNPIIANFQLDMVTSPTQAMRLTKIHAHNVRRQLNVKFTAPPEAYALVNGSPAALALPGYSFLDGNYRVESIRPKLIGDDQAEGVTLQCAISLVEWSPDGYAWAASEEFQVTSGASIEVEKAPIEPPGTVAFSSGSSTALDTGGGVLIPRLLVTFEPSTSASVESYEIEFRQSGSGDSFVLAGTAPAEQTDGSGDVFFYLSSVTAGQDYDVRVRARSDFGVSSYVTTNSVTVNAPNVTVSAPTNVSVQITGQTTALLTCTSPNESDFAAIEVYANTSDTSTGATLVGGPTFFPPSTVINVGCTGLTAGTLYYFFARSIDKFSGASGFAASVNDTTDP